MIFGVHIQQGGGPQTPGERSEVLRVESEDVHRIVRWIESLPIPGESSDDDFAAFDIFVGDVPDPDEDVPFSPLVTVMFKGTNPPETIRFERDGSC